MIIYRDTGSTKGIDMIIYRDLIIYRGTSGTKRFDHLRSNMYR